MFAPRYALTLVLAACGSSDPATSADSGASGTSVAARLCAAYRTNNCPSSPTCEAEFTMLRSGVVPQCAALADAYYGCGANNAASTSCANLALGQFNNCATQQAAFMACGTGDAGTTMACPSVGGTYSGNAPEAGCGSGTFTIMQPTAGGPCTIHIDWVNPANGDTRTGTNDPLIDVSGRGSRGSSFANADRSTVVQSDLTFALSATGGQITYGSGEFACTYTLTR